MSCYETKTVVQVVHAEVHQILNGPEREDAHRKQRGPSDAATLLCTCHLICSECGQGYWLANVKFPRPLCAALGAVSVFLWTLLWAKVESELSFQPTPNPPTRTCQS